MVPWKFQLTDGTPVKIVVEEKSPYVIRTDGTHLEFRRSRFRWTNELMWPM